MYHVQSRSRVKNPPDFIGRNRRAVREQQQARATQRLSKPPEKKERSQKDVGKKGGKDTVEISKNDLEKLLKMASSLQQQPQISTNHVAPNPALIPGLDAHYAGQQSQLSEQQLQNIPVNDTAQGTANRGGMEEKRRPHQTEEEYYPWGRPGGGAPIRTISGTLLTNYSTRGQEVEMNRLQHNQNLFSTSDKMEPSFSNKTRDLLSTSDKPGAAKSAQVLSPPSQRPQFARGFGPHVDSFILSQREELRRKEQKHKDELAAQIAERKRQKEEEKRRREEEEREAERRVRRELEEMNIRNERERQLREQKAEEERVWKAELQNRIQEAEDAALRERHQMMLNQQFTSPPTHQYHHHLPPPPPPNPLPPTHHPPPSLPPPPSNLPQQHRYPLQTGHTNTIKPSRIPLPSQNRAPPPGHSLQAASHNTTTTVHKAPSVATEMTYRTLYQQKRAPSPVVPALAKKLGLQQQQTTSGTKPSPPPPLPPSLPNITTSVPTDSHLSNKRTPSLPPLAPAADPEPQEDFPPLPSYMLPSKLDHESLPSLPPPPPLPPAAAQTTTSFPSQPPPLTTPRQKEILTQIALLREGILSQRKSLDHRISSKTIK